jgi:hypothetical protein
MLDAISKTGWTCVVHFCHIGRCHACAVSVSQQDLPDTRYREEGGDIEFLSLVKLQKKKGGIAPAPSIANFPARRQYGTARAVIAHP